MSYQVFLTDDATYDLEHLYDYIESHDVPEKAGYVVDKLTRHCQVWSITQSAGLIQRSCSLSV